MSLPQNLELFAPPPDPVDTVLDEPSRANARTLVVVGCSKTKADVEWAQAQDLYTSPFFRYARAYAETRPYEWAIFSAEHGLLPPDEEVARYDWTLSDLDADERTDLTGEIETQLALYYPNVRTAICLAGSLYSNMLDQVVDTVDTPMDGMQIGERLHWLREELVNTRDRYPALWDGLSAASAQWLEGKLDPPWPTVCEKDVPGEAPHECYGHCTPGLAPELPRPKYRITHWKHPDKGYAGCGKKNVTASHGDVGLVDLGEGLPAVTCRNCVKASAKWQREQRDLDEAIDLSDPPTIYETAPCERCSQPVDDNDPSVLGDTTPTLCRFCWELDVKAFKKTTHQRSSMDDDGSVCGRGKVMPDHLGLYGVTCKSCLRMNSGHMERLSRLYSPGGPSWRRAISAHRRLAFVCPDNCPLCDMDHPNHTCTSPACCSEPCADCGVRRETTTDHSYGDLPLCVKCQNKRFNLRNTEPKGTMVEIEATASDREAERRAETHTQTCMGCDDPLEDGDVELCKGCHFSTARKLTNAERADLVQVLNEHQAGTAIDSLFDTLPDTSTDEDW